MAIQDHYPENLAHCYGCGRLNEQGHHIRTDWDGDETVAVFTPEPWHIAIPGFVYGGVIASLVDCHSTGTAAAAAYRAASREPGTEPPFRFVTGALRVDYLKPTPLGPPLTIRARVKEKRGAKWWSNPRFTLKASPRRAAKSLLFRCRTTSVRTEAEPSNHNASPERPRRAKPSLT